MKPSLLSLFRRFLPVVVLLGLSACSLPTAKPDLTRYFLLSAPAASAEEIPTAPRTVTVGLGRVELPAYLRTSGIVLRPGGTELRHAPAARWGEPLDQGIGRVLKEALLARPPVRTVVVYPSPQAPTPDYEVFVTVLACEGVSEPPGRQTRFSASWEIRSTAAGAAPLASGTFEGAPAEWSEGDYAALTEKLGESVAALGRELAAALAR